MSNKVHKVNLAMIKKIRTKLYEENSVGIYNDRNGIKSKLNRLNTIINHSSLTYL